MSKTEGDEWDKSLEHHRNFLTSRNSHGEQETNAHKEAIKNTPIFSAIVAKHVFAQGIQDAFPQYGLLGEKEMVFGHDSSSDAENETSKQSSAESEDERVFLNVHAPFSAFICGSQGSGKSHTLSCMLETALISSGGLGKLPWPLTGIVFHWDKAGNQLCEAAYLCSSGIPVTVLVSPSNFDHLKEAYGNLPGEAKPVIRPLLLRQKHLSRKRMMELMAADKDNASQALYMEVVQKILRDMGFDRRGSQDFDYKDFKLRLGTAGFNTTQTSSLNMRLSLLEGFLDGILEETGVPFYEEPMPVFHATIDGMRRKQRWKDEQRSKRLNQPDIWSSKPRSLTIVDLSDPLVSDGNSACALFNMCLDLFLQHHPDGGTILALDEAHKYMSEEGAASDFADNLSDAVRLQRHQGTRIIIATQEPTISTRLLDLCSMTIVHRFSSPAWLQTLKVHIAGVSAAIEQDSQRSIPDILRMIVNLEAGQALLFAPSALLDVANDGASSSSNAPKIQKLGLRYVKMRVRKRLTEDGGRSVMSVKSK